MPSRTATSTLTPAAIAEHLEGLLARLTERYTLAQQLLNEHRDALRRADGPAVAALAERESEVLEELGALDAVRRELIAAAAPLLPRVPHPVTLTHLAGLLPEADRSRLTAAANRLRRLAEDVRDRTAVIRAATASLLTHMEGLARQVGKNLSHAGTYGRRGTVDTGQPVLSALDLRS